MAVYYQHFILPQIPKSEKIKIASLKKLLERFQTSNIIKKEGDASVSVPPFDSENEKKGNFQSILGDLPENTDNYIFQVAGNPSVIGEVFDEDSFANQEDMNNSYLDIYLVSSDYPLIFPDGGMIEATLVGEKGEMVDTENICVDSMGKGVLKISMPYRFVDDSVPINQKFVMNYLCAKDLSKKEISFSPSNFGLMIETGKTVTKDGSLKLTDKFKKILKELGFTEFKEYPYFV